MEAQHSNPVLNLHELLWESYTFTSMCRIVMTSRPNYNIAINCVVLVHLMLLYIQSLSCYFWIKTCLYKIYGSYSGVAEDLILLDVALCHSVSSSQRFEGSMILKNGRDCLPNNTVWYHRRLHCSKIWLPAIVKEKSGVGFKSLISYS